MNQLQSLVTGMVAGALAREGHRVDLEVSVPMDDDRNYLPQVIVKGRGSGTVLRISVDVVTDDGDTTVPAARVVPPPNPSTK